ncbi:hypothetical protein [Priestia megaterium]|uniref:hypothetical protein n=1 Tax=Priestia megaterium TaxID=1404 RepID=UPI0024530CB1|nr:hypothetical protein [Priestia megaterium]MDH3155935.1 hypothetical protein [Priestia megaterium]MED4116360.1 hypothetical protein [Priestia megaterium]
MSIRKTEIKFKKMVCVFDGQEEGLSIKKEEEYYGFETADARGYNVFSDMGVDKDVLSNWIGSYPKTYFELVDDKI